MKGHQDDLHKKLPAVWDAIDQHKWTVALRLLSPLMQKYPESSVVNACSALCYHYSDAKELSRKIMAKLLETPQTDPRAIQPMRIVLSNDEDWKNLSRMFKMNFEATQRIEDGEEYFLALARERRFNDMQAAALHLHRLSKTARHKRWQIASMYLQCPVQGVTKTPAADPAANLHVKLCIGTLERSLQQEDQHADSFQMLVELKQQCGKQAEAAELLLSELGAKCNTMYSEEMRFIFAARLLLEGNQGAKAYALLTHLARDLAIDNYAVYRMLVDATGRVTGAAGFQGSEECSVAIPAKGVTAQATCSHDGAVEFLTGLATRGAQLGALELLTATLEARVGTPEGLVPLRHMSNPAAPVSSHTDAELSDSFFSILACFVKGHIGKPCCYPDVMDYLPRAAAFLKLSPAEFTARLKQEVGDNQHGDAFYFRASYALGAFDSFSEDAALEFAADCLAKFEEAYRGDHAEAARKAEDSERPEDHYIIVAVLVLLQNAQQLLGKPGARALRIKYTLVAAAVVEAALAVRTRNYEFYCLKCRLQALLGCPDISFAQQMDLKNIQHDSLSYLLIHCLSRCGQWANVRRMCNAITHFHRTYNRDYPNQFTQLFEHGTLSKLGEFLKFETRVRKSVTRLEADLECMLQITIADPVGGNADFKEFLSTVEPALPVFLAAVREGAGDVCSNEDFTVIDLLLKRPMGAHALALRGLLLPLECSSPDVLAPRIAYCRSVLASILCARAILHCETQHAAVVKEKQQTKASSKREGAKANGAAKANEAATEEPKDAVFTCPLAASEFFARSVSEVLAAPSADAPKTWPTNGLPLRALEKLFAFAAMLAKLYSERASEDLTAEEATKVVALLDEATAAANAVKDYFGPIVAYLGSGTVEEAKLQELLGATPVHGLDISALFAPLSRTVGLVVEVFNLLVKWRVVRNCAPLKEGVLKYFKAMAAVLQLGTDYSAGLATTDKKRAWALGKGLIGVEEALQAHPALTGAHPNGVADRLRRVSASLATHAAAQAGEARRLLEEQTAEFAKKFPKLLEK